MTLLSEVEQVATHFAILSAGDVQFEGTLQDLRTRTEPMIVIEVDQPERARVLLEAAGCAVK